MISDDEDSLLGSGDYGNLTTAYTPTTHSPVVTRFTTVVTRYTTTISSYYSTTSRTKVPNLRLKLFSIDPDLAISVLWLITILVLLVTITFALVTWIVVPIWRSFKHFAIVNILVSKTLLLTFSVISLFYPGLMIEETGRQTVYFLAFPRLSLMLWLLVVSFVFYTDKVTDIIVEWEIYYLKACIFAWGIPLFISFGIYTSYYLTPVAMLSYIIVILLNIVIYTIILCKSFANGRRSESIMKFVKATAIFFVTSLFMLVPYLYDIFFAIPDLKILIIVNGIILNLAFMCMRSNWWTWSEYFVMRRGEDVIVVNWEGRNDNNVTLVSPVMKEDRGDGAESA